MNLNDLFLRMRAIVFQGRAERDLEEELALHLEMQVRKNLRAGIGEAEARAVALARFGRPAAVREECRDERRTGLFDALRQDVRYTLRGFRRPPPSH